jgi:hypothetical protein
MTKQNNEYSHSNLILCEGTADVNFLTALLEKRNIGGWHIEDTSTSNSKGKGGRDSFGKKLQAVSTGINSSIINNILLIGDADNNRKGAIENIQRQIDQSNHKENGWNPIIKILLIPNEGNGELETLLGDAAKDINSEFTKPVDKFCNEATSSEWSENEKKLLWLRALFSLSIKDNPFATVAEIFSKEKYWSKTIDFNSPKFNFITNFLTKEFSHDN